MISKRQEVGAMPCMTVLLEMPTQTGQAAVSSDPCWRLKLCLQCSAILRIHPSVGAPRTTVWVFVEMPMVQFIVQTLERTLGHILEETRSVTLDPVSEFVYFETRNGVVIQSRFAAL